MTYRFVGTLCEVDEKLKLERLGQSAALSDTQADNVIAGGGSILPDDVFSGIGFTDQELTDYAYPGQRIEAPEGFKAKMSAAYIAMHEHRTAVLARLDGGK